MYVFSCSEYYLCEGGTKEERKFDWQRKRVEDVSSCIHMHDLPVWRELVLLQLSGTALALLAPPIYSAMLKGTETEGKTQRVKKLFNIKKLN